METEKIDKIFNERNGDEKMDKIWFRRLKEDGKRFGKIRKKTIWFPLKSSFFFAGQISIWDEKKTTESVYSMRAAECPTSRARCAKNGCPSPMTKSVFKTAHSDLHMLRRKLKLGCPQSKYDIISCHIMCGKKRSHGFFCCEPRQIDLFLIILESGFHYLDTQYVVLSCVFY